MKIGIIGTAKAGKTTIFNTITGLDAGTGLYDQKIEPNIGTVQVLDERITHLSEIYKPKKTIYATTEFLDFPGMQENAENHEFLSAVSMNLMRTTDALMVVLRNFSEPVLDDTYGKADPLDHIRRISEEFILSDLVIAENRLEKIELGYKRGIRTPAVQIEEKAIRTIIEALGNEIPLRKITLPEEELKAVRGFQFLSLKPIMVILNSDEKNFNQNQEILDKLSALDYLPIEFAGKFEMELSRMDETEAAIFMEDIGIKESGILRVTKTAYHLLGYISFFTVGPDEVRAWTINKGDNAVTAAGKIHSDLARGFIRAETFCYADIVTHGSEKVIREKGLFRLEGKTYLVQDGDILNIRFNV
ncbi:MAG: YchF family ATPase [Candidatus Cloacimonetes bacterium]|nr:YchF family ATPase [Candidatus Cloacimonadota bacterium]